MEDQLRAMTMEQLQRYRKQLEEEKNAIQSNLNALTTAQERFSMSLQTIMVLKDQDQSIMIPLTSSMFVRGKTNTKGGKVVVDLGTGFHVEVSNEDGQGILKRKIDYINRNRKAMADQLRQLAEMNQISLRVLQQRVAETTNQAKPPA